MAAKLIGLTHKIAIQLNLLTERCTTCSSRSRRQVRKLLDTASYTWKQYGVVQYKYLVVSYIIFISAALLNCEVLWCEFNVQQIYRSEIAICIRRWTHPQNNISIIHRKCN